MHIFNVGEKAIVRKDMQKLVDENKFNIVQSMVKYAGKTVTIARRSGTSNNPSYEIIEDGKTFIWEEGCFICKMTKERLKSGYLCKVRDGGWYVVIKNADTEYFTGDVLLDINDGYGWNMLNDYNDDLKCVSSDFDIMEVYKQHHPINITGNKSSSSELKLLWKIDERGEILRKASRSCGMKIELRG